VKADVNTDLRRDKKQRQRLALRDTILKQVAGWLHGKKTYRGVCEMDSHAHRAMSAKFTRDKGGACK
jgi:hypothetical protein